jgi:tetratricopeptide (TPR) repeat protein
MATAKISKKAMAQDEFIEGVFDFGEWLEVHWRRVAIAVGIAVALVLGAIAWSSMRESATQDANRLLASGLEAYAPAPGDTGAAPAPRYTEALSFFEQAEKRGGSGALTDVARLFRARTLLALSRAAEAVPVLDGLTKSGNPIIAAEAKIAMAGAAEATGDAERAATLLNEVATAEKPLYPQDAALMLLGGLRERQGKKDEAKKAYDDLLAKFPQSSFASDAKQRSAALTAR